MSLTESGVNIVCGYIVALISQIMIFPLFDINVNLQTNIKIGLWFTVVSLVRSYVLRRLFNKMGEFKWRKGKIR